MPYKIILFYKFIEIENPDKLRAEQQELANSLQLKGRMLIAHEGVNATFEGMVENIDKYERALHADGRFSNIVFKKSDGDGTAFTKLSVKVRPEVVTLQAGRLDIKNKTAPEISADELQNLYERGEDFVVLDLRNDYEIEVGKFEKTVHPNLRNFRDLPAKLSELQNLKNKKVVAVCTGGIRCEKATCLLKDRGFENLYQLKDGIHTYMQKYPGKHFQGSLFVFDNRMTTPVVDLPDRQIIGKCKYCHIPCEDYYSDDSVRPSEKVICCPECIESRSDTLRTCKP